MTTGDEHPTLSGLRLKDHQGPLYRNILLAPDAQTTDDALFDDLSEHPHERGAAGRLLRRRAALSGMILAPFQRAERLRALAWPSCPWMGSRFSDGRHGVWYGALDIDTGVQETAWHWRQDFLADAGFMRDGLVAHRRVMRVECRAGLLDLSRPHRQRDTWLHPSRLQAPRALGARLRHEGHPGLLWPSVRHAGGTCAGIFNPQVLSAPQTHAELRYRLSGGKVLVEPLNAPSSSAGASAKTPADPR